MHKTLFIALTLVLGLALSAPAFAASGSSGEANPIVNLSGLSRPGLWKTTSTVTVAGKTHKSTDTECITEAQLKDILNHSGSDIQPSVTDYSLHGHHLHISGTMGHGATFEQDMIFDDRDHTHGSMIVKSASGHTFRSSSKGHRVGPCKAGNLHNH